MEKKIDLLDTARKATDPAASDDDRDGFMVQIAVLRPKGHRPNLGDREYADRLIKDGKAPKVRLTDDMGTELDPDAEEDEPEEDAPSEEGEPMEEPAVEDTAEAEAKGLLESCGVPPDEHHELVQKLIEAMRAKAG